MLYLPDYGPCGAGNATDDTATLNAARAACGDKQITIPKLANPLLLNSRMQFPACEMIVEGNQAFKRTSSIPSGQQTLWMPYGGRVAGLTIDGNASGVSYNSVSEFACSNTGYRLVVDNVRIVNFTHMGMETVDGELEVNNPYIDGSAAVNPGASGSSYGMWLGTINSRNTINGGVIKNCYNGGIYGGGDTSAISTVFKNNHRQYLYSGGGQVATGGNTRSMRFINCTFEGNGATSSTVEGGLASGAELDNCAWTIMGCHFYNIKGATPASPIVIQGNYKHRIIGNLFGSDCTRTINQTHGGASVAYMAGNLQV